MTQRNSSSVEIEKPQVRPKEKFVCATCLLEHRYNVHGMNSIAATVLYFIGTIRRCICHTCNFMCVRLDDVAKQEVGVAEWVSL